MKKIWPNNDGSNAMPTISAQANGVGHNASPASHSPNANCSEAANADNASTAKNASGYTTGRDRSATV